MFFKRQQENIIKNESNEAEKEKKQSETIVNKLDDLIAKFSKKHNFNFKFLDNHELMKENNEPNLNLKFNPQNADDVVSKIKNK